MQLILLKSSACLLFFMAFYKVFLERTSNHQFKRFYLLSVVLISIGIPFITVIEYIEPQFVLGDFGAALNNPIKVPEPQKESIHFVSFILWGVYGIGVLLFSIRFSSNLIRILLKIKRNPKLKTSNFISVLLQDLVVPHTFFSYIFLNKTKYENKEIPYEVLLHEETHAKQKHSIDILFIELLQIIFWFNPLLYILKRDIKLNHEFLADHAVINQGIPLPKYQQLLLEFSSNSSSNQLANAINYSLIKKRFTVMKTKTSKQSILLRNLLLLPLLGGLIYGFSTTKQVEKEVIPKLIIENNSVQNEIPILFIEQNSFKLKLNGKETSLVDLKEDFFKATNGRKSDLRIKALGAVNFNLIKDIMKETEGILEKIILSDGAYIQDTTDYSKTETQKQATPEQIAEYNKLARHYNSQPEDKRIVKLKDLKRLEYLFSLMSESQKAKAEPFPNCPPPPPAPKVVKGELSDIPPPPAPKVVKGEFSDIPPPPKSPLDHVIDMAKKGAIFYYEGKKITSDEAIKFLKENESLNISSNSNDGISTVKISTKPISIDN